MHGHWWTVGPTLRDRLRPPGAPPARPWTTVVQDPRIGPVRLTGLFQDGTSDGGADAAGGGGPTVVLLVHGLGGSATSSYMVRAAAGCAALGIACLRLNMRGCDRLGEDFYHAGLTADLHAALASPELAPYNRLYAFGNSLGGHLALRLACDQHDPRLRAVAAISAPLDLAASAAAIDGPVLGLYRRYLLGNLKEIYAAVAARRPVPTPVEEAKRIRYLRTWDRKTVAPRHGFANAADYYRRESVGPRLPDLKLPALLVTADHDPMLPPSTLRPALAAASPALEVHWVRRGGHMGFHADLDLGLNAPLGLSSQVLAWLRQQ